jgi:hypothetical protein
LVGPSAEGGFVHDAVADFEGVFPLHALLPLVDRHHVRDE